jgi:hypothetical protein
MPQTIAITLLALFVAAPLRGQQVDSVTARSDPSPLFSSYDLLELTIEAPLKQLTRDRRDNRPFRPAVLRFVDRDGEESELRIALRTRGNFRLQPSVCDFPNFFVRFDDTGLAETIFADQTVLPLLTHCRTKRSEYEQFALLEYLVHRTYSVLTERSLRARLVRITYLDPDDDGEGITRYAVFMEHFDQLAARHGWKVLQVPIVPPDQVDAFDLTRFEVFQFMIGNTDFDPFHAEPDEDACCHNAVLIGTMIGPVIPVPFDFDWSGVVDAPYARPDPRLGIRTVRQRRYWGACRPREQLEAVFPLFHERRDAIYDLFRDQEGLEPKSRDRTLEYFDEFYALIDDERRVEREMESQCRKWR